MQFPGKWKPKGAAMRRFRRILYTVSTVSVFLMAIGAGWRPK